MFNKFLYHYNSQYHRGAVLSFAIEYKNTSQITSLLDDLRATRNEAHSLSLYPNARESEEDEEECPDNHGAILHPYWTDRYPHPPLYHQAYSTQGIVNIQRALLAAIGRRNVGILSFPLELRERVDFCHGIVAFRVYC
ncbi:uncharacterized protein EURHEDRAFT_400750 [Aspergillus ruber CBS 135680]|uniref:Uncharacterized protein n=1 Tax=Aspergillus ruber (strain CBS 135680) TaxID=1388766 RepID=A0A017SM89_ASPRC|nr:uncharacterized protein EURHEDRAFT_400750 [Aspergillus ruber CBS 135680]EYE97759.1 hypothetical protein EURHEDRAFT_400750 [Aspergillus ruber CBS 135680]